MACFEAIADMAQLLGVAWPWRLAARLKHEATKGLSGESLLIAMVPGFDAGTPTQAAFGCLLSKRCRDWTGKANRMRVPSMRFSVPRSNEFCAFHARPFALLGAVLFTKPLTVSNGYSSFCPPGIPRSCESDLLAFGSMTDRLLNRLAIGLRKPLFATMSLPHADRMVNCSTRLILTLGTVLKCFGFLFIMKSPDHAAT